MTEISEPQNIKEIGENDFTQLVSVLKAREDEGYTVVGWQGTSSDLSRLVNEGELCPASSFAVVAEGISRYKRTNPKMREDTDSLRELSKVLERGSQVYIQAAMIDEVAVKDQVKKYVDSNGGSFDNSTNWGEFIADRAAKLQAKANAIDDVNN